MEVEESLVGGGTVRVLIDGTNAQPARSGNAVEDTGGIDHGAEAEISDEQAAEMVSKLVRSGIPLTLIADLINPSAPDSVQILSEELSDAEDLDPADFSQTPER